MIYIVSGQLYRDTYRIVAYPNRPSPTVSPICDRDITKRSLFLADYTHLYKSHVNYLNFTAKCHITTYIRQLLSCFVNVNTA